MAPNNDTENNSMHLLFCSEVETHSVTLNKCLSNVKSYPGQIVDIDLVIRATHSIKGAAQIVQVEPAVKIAHTLKVFFVSVQNGQTTLTTENIDILLEGVDTLSTISKISENDIKNWQLDNVDKIENVVDNIEALITSTSNDNPKAETPSEHQNKKSEIAPPPSTSTPNLQQEIQEASMYDLFKIEIETHTSSMNDNVLELETNPSKQGVLDALMRSIHSIKGAAKFLDIDPIVKIAHMMEDCFIQVKEQDGLFLSDHVDLLFDGIDMIVFVSKIDEYDLEKWELDNADNIEKIINNIKAIVTEASTDCKKQTGIDEIKADAEIEIETEPETVIKTNGEIKKSPPKITSPQTDNSLIDMEDASMYALFCMEVETHTLTISEGLLDLESDHTKLGVLEDVMRAAHSIKGAAKFLDIEPAVKIAHILEDCFGLARDGKVVLTAEHIDIFLKCVDMLMLIAKVPEVEMNNWQKDKRLEIDSFINEINSILYPDSYETNEKTDTNIYDAKNDQSNKDFVENENILSAVDESGEKALKKVEKQKPVNDINNEVDDRTVRVSVENLNRLMGLAGESLIEANWLEPFSNSLKKLKYMQMEVNDLLEKFQVLVPENELKNRADNYLTETFNKVNECNEFVVDYLSNIENFSRRSSNLSNRLYQEVISSRMQQFAEGVRGFPRMVRDLAKKLKKDVKLKIVGKSTKVDRDILVKLDAPISHILRNSIDHGVEDPSERIKIGKQPKATVSIEASHKAGMLSITISDDGRGIDHENLRKKIVEKNMVNSEMARKLTKDELIEFLFLPGFSTSEKVTEISGRGVGMDVVKNMIYEVDGTLRIESEKGKGICLFMLLPLTRSVTRTLLVEIANEPYAFPITRIDRALKIPKTAIKLLEDKQFFTFNEKNIGLISAYQLFGINKNESVEDELSVVVISDLYNQYGIVVDHFLGESSLVVKTLDSRLGKISNITAAAILEDGSPVLIIDVEDMAKSINKILSTEELRKVGRYVKKEDQKKVKKILVVDDSITVREVVRKLLQNNGYKVEIAVDGRDGWNAVRSGDFNLVISDVDMPRMNGFELVKLIKSDSRLKSIPVMIVSYKDCEEDKMQGLSAGANYYLTKSSFHDDSLLNAVVDLVGVAV